MPAKTKTKTKPINLLIKLDGEIAENLREAAKSENRSASQQAKTTLETTYSSRR